MASSNPSITAHLDPAYEQLRSLERFKSGFLARTSHELRSPINTIVSLSQLILEDLCESPEEEKEFIAQSKAAALKMLALFDQIAAVSKLDIGREPATLSSVDLSFLLPEVEMLTALQAANQNVRYIVDAPTDELEIYTDSKWLKNTLVNLIQDTLFHTKSLGLFIECNQTEVAIVLECDRPTGQLQSNLDNLSQLSLNSTSPDSTSPDSDSPGFNSFDSNPLDSNPSNLGPASRTDTSKDVQLSTALILATATITLPLINGKFEISPQSASGDRTHLKCIFPRSTS